MVGNQIVLLGRATGACVLIVNGIGTKVRMKTTKPKTAMDFATGVHRRDHVERRRVNSPEDEQQNQPEQPRIAAREDEQHHRADQRVEQQPRRARRSANRGCDRRPTAQSGSGSAPVTSSPVQPAHAS